MLRLILYRFCQLNSLVLGFLVTTLVSVRFPCDYLSSEVCGAIKYHYTHGLTNCRGGVESDWKEQEKHALASR